MVDRPRKSGVNTSMRVSGDWRRTARMHSAKCVAPPSRRSSRSTLVMRTCFRPSRATAWARCWGSSGSGGDGRPCATSQNGQRRVHRSPSAMKVAVPLPKHSPMFGHEASPHAVCRFASRRTRLTSRKFSLGETRAHIHSGLGKTGPVSTLIGIRAVLALPCCGLGTAISFIAVTLRPPSQRPCLRAHVAPRRQTPPAGRHAPSDLRQR